jgi:PQQ-dependent catabolism-associated CXXCW motif protein
MPQTLMSAVVLGLAIAQGSATAASAAPPTEVAPAAATFVLATPAGVSADSVLAAPAGISADPVLATPAVGAAAPEPSGYWTGPVNSAVPETITGGKVIHDAHRLRALLKHPGTVIVDVSNAPRRPENLATGAPWLPLPHRAIPGTLWIPGVGAGEIPPAVDEFFRKELAAATGGDLTRRVVIYCHQTCWLSWNAAKRAIGYGYRNIYWFRDGIEGWQAAHFPTAVIEPQAVPEAPAG